MDNFEELATSTASFIVQLQHPAASISVSTIPSGEFDTANPVIVFDEPFIPIAIMESLQLKDYLLLV